jgi:hypothetical protein
MGDRASEYLASVLAHDPAESAGDILRLRRAFLGGPDAPSVPDRVAPDLEREFAERSERRGREARVKARKLVAAAKRTEYADRSGESGISGWTWFALVVLALRLLSHLISDR